MKQPGAGEGEEINKEHDAAIDELIRLRTESEADIIDLERLRRLHDHLRLPVTQAALIELLKSYTDSLTLNAASAGVNIYTGQVHGLFDGARPAYDPAIRARLLAAMGVADGK